jgi:gluconate kinase
MSSAMVDSQLNTLEDTATSEGDITLLNAAQSRQKMLEDVEGFVQGLLGA